MSEYEMISLIMEYVEEIKQGFEMYMGACIAMIIAGFVAGNQLTKPIKIFVIMLYSGYCIISLIMTILWYGRIEQGIESLKIITAGNVQQLPLTQAILDNIVAGNMNWGVYFVMIFIWAGAVGLMVFRDQFNKS